MNRPLKRIMSRRVLYGYPFPCGEFVQCPLPVQTADAGCFFPTEGNERFVIDGGVIYMDHSRINLLREFGAPFCVPCVNSSAQSEGRIVGESNRIFGSIEG